MAQPLTALTIPAPGFRGLFTQLQALTLEQDCALKANNCV